MPQVTYRGQKFYANSAIPRKGIAKLERERLIRGMIDDKSLVPFSERPKLPRKPNPNKGKKCALWIDKNERVERPLGLESRVVPRIPPKPVPRPAPTPPPIPRKPSTKPSTKPKRGRPKKIMSQAQFAANWRKEKGMSGKMTKWTKELRDDYEAYKKNK